MTWTKLSADEVSLFEAGDDGPGGPDGEMWSLSPCGVPIATWGNGVDHALSVLHVHCLHAAVREVLERATADWFIDPRCIADFWAGYGLMSRLAPLLEHSRPACHYVLSLSDNADEVTHENIRKARDTARSALAKHAASDSLREIARLAAMKELN